jgi:hypothetical protein
MEPSQLLLHFPVIRKVLVPSFHLLSLLLTALQDIAYLTIEGLLSFSPAFCVFSIWSTAQKDLLVYALLH